MIDTVWFRDAAGEALRPCEGFGMIMVSHDAPPPEVRTYMVMLDGADGALDLSDWAGGPRYAERSVTVRLRDMTGSGAEEVVGFVLSRRVEIYFSEQPGWHYEGRCVKADRVTRRRVTDLALTFRCEPYRLRDSLTKVTLSAAEGEADEARVRVAGRAVWPQIEADGACALYVDGEMYASAEAGAIVWEKGWHTLRVEGPARVSVWWRDGVI